MLGIDLLTREPTWLPIKAPAFCWMAAAGLVLLAAYQHSRLRGAVKRQCAIQSGARKALEDIAHNTAPVAMGRGLSARGYEEISQLFEGLPLRSAWRSFRRLLLVERDLTGQDCWYSTESADVSFGEAAVLGSHLDFEFHRALPGIITGLGLLVTFIAILFALVGVHYDSEKITGLEQLINGLSGKFVSSIAALLAASMYLLAEKAHPPSF